MEKVLNEFVEWFNERNSYPIYPCEKDVKMFLSFKTNEPCERKADSNNEAKKKECHVPILNGVNQVCINPTLDCDNCQFWHS